MSRVTRSIHSSEDGGDEGPPGAGGSLAQ